MITKNFFNKNSLKVALLYLFRVFILFNIVFNLKLNFKLKIDPKMRTFKMLEEVWKTHKTENMSGNPVYKTAKFFY